MATNLTVTTRDFLTSSPVNMVINNLFWVGCVAGRYELIFIVTPSIMIYIALLLYSQKIELFQLLIPVSMGILIDSIYTASGVFQFEQDNLFLPLWMCMLWVAFSTTLPLSLKLVSKNIYLTAATGAIGFPFSFYLGAKLGAVSFSLPFPLVAVMLAITWAIALPLMFHFINRPISKLSEAF